MDTKRAAMLIQTTWRKYGGIRQLAQRLLRVMTPEMSFEQLVRAVHAAKIYMLIFKCLKWIRLKIGVNRFEKPTNSELHVLIGAFIIYRFPAKVGLRAEDPVTKAACNMIASFSSLLVELARGGWLESTECFVHDFNDFFPLFDRLLAALPKLPPSKRH